MAINRFMSSWVWEEQEKKKKLRQVSFGTCIESPHVLNTHTHWHTSRRSQSVRPRRRVFEEAAAAEVHPLCGPRARRKHSQTHTVSKKEITVGFGPIARSIGSVLQEQKRQKRCHHHRRRTATHTRHWLATTNSGYIWSTRTNGRRDAFTLG